MKIWWIIDKLKTHILFIILAAHLTLVFSQNGSDELNYTLDSVTISSFKISSAVTNTGNGGIDVRLDVLERMSGIAGSADPISFARLLPGVQTVGEYNGGFNVNGSENGHNYISINGVQLYNVNHLLGFFSTFISSHYEHMSLNKFPDNSGSPNRIGAELSFYPRINMADSTLSGNIVTGLISSQGTIHIPTGRKSGLNVSLRKSYVNLLYSGLLDNDDTSLNYSFYDANLTWFCRLNDRNNLILDFYSGSDNAKIRYDGDYLADLRCIWGNNLVSFHWLCRVNEMLDLKNTVYYTSYKNTFTVSHEDGKMRMPSGISDYGYKGCLGYNGLTFGFEAVCHSIDMQSPMVSETYNANNSDYNHNVSSEYSANADYTLSLGNSLKIRAGIRANSFLNGGTSYYSVDPCLSLLYEIRQYDSKVSLNFTQKHQFLFLTGLTDTGLPIEFWISSDEHRRPQYSRGCDLNWSMDIARGRFGLSSSLYYWRLYDQLIYRGSLVDYLTTAYNIDSHLYKGDGYNYGADIMFSKTSGLLTGWLSYSYGRAIRRFDSIGKDRHFPASHERVHELDLFADYRLNDRINTSLSFVAAGGAPFTAPEYFYIMNQNVITQYGEYNSHRMRPYIRMDIGADYSLRTRPGSRIKRHGLNASIYNVLLRNNDLAYGIKIYDGSVYYHHVSFFSTILPALSYYCSF